MGYRSDVAFVLCKYDFDRLVDEMKVVDSSMAECLVDNAKYMTTPDEVYVKSTFEWYKWYDEYKEVDLINKFLSKTRHTFVRIGEDADDTVVDIVSEDERGVDEEFYYMLWVDRKIGGEFVED